VILRQGVEARGGLADVVVETPVRGGRSAELAGILRFALNDIVKRFAELIQNLFSEFLNNPSRKQRVRLLFPRPRPTPRPIEN
jgi:hypothetical protein